MINKDFMLLVKNFIKNMEDKINTKGHDYTGDNNDRLINHKRRGQNLEISGLRVCLSDMSKHLEAIYQFDCRKEKKSNENLTERFVDIAVYAILGASLCDDMLKEYKNEK